MTITISKEWIASLAPDASSLKDGIGLAKPLKWTNLSKHPAGIWGDCQGSAKTPYQVRIALTDFKIYCNCPSRKRPCKHALGLLTLFSQEMHLFNEQSELPEILLPKTLTTKTEKAAEKETEKAADKDAAKKLAAQRKRQAEREKKIADGLEALDLWLNDLARQGLSRLSPRFYQDISARLVDAQAGGLANLLRGLAALPLQSDGYEPRLLQALSQVFLLSQAYRCQEKLSQSLQAEVRRRVGWNVNKEELLGDSGVEDHWLLLGKNYEAQDFLTSEQLWFIGKKTAQMLLIWNFLAGGATPSVLQIGQHIAAKAHFYPSPWPLRAVFAEKSEGVTYHLVSKEAKDFPAIPENQGYNDWQKLLDDFSLALADNPFLEKFPAVIHKVSIQMPGNNKTKFFLCDQSEQALPLINSQNTLWRFLAVARGQPVTAFVFLSNGEIFLQSIFTSAQAFSPESSLSEF